MDTQAAHKRSNLKATLSQTSQDSFACLQAAHASEQHAHRSTTRDHTTVSFRAEHNSPLFQQNYCSLSGVPPSIHLKAAISLVPSLHFTATLALFFTSS